MKRPSPPSLLPLLGRNPPFDLLLHPVTLLALGLLVFNDGWLRGTYPNWLTGKLSDIAAVIAFPGLLTALWGLFGMGVDRALGLGCGDTMARGVDYSLRRWVALSATLLTGGILTGINLDPGCRDLYLRGLYWLDPFEAFGPFSYTMDPSDLLALLFLPVPIWAATHHILRIPAGRLRAAYRRALRAAARIAPGGELHATGGGGPPELDPASPLIQACRRAIVHSLGDISRGIASSRAHDFEAVVDLLTESAARETLARLPPLPHTPQLALEPRGHYHRLRQALTAFRTGRIDA